MAVSRLMSVVAVREITDTRTYRARPNTPLTREGETETSAGVVLDRTRRSWLVLIPSKTDTDDGGDHA